MFTCRLPALTHSRHTNPSSPPATAVGGTNVSPCPPRMRKKTVKKVTFRLLVFPPPSLKMVGAMGHGDADRTDSARAVATAVPEAQGSGADGRTKNIVGVAPRRTSPRSSPRSRPAASSTRSPAPARSPSSRPPTRRSPRCPRPSSTTCSTPRTRRSSSTCSRTTLPPAPCTPPT